MSDKPVIFIYSGAAPGLVAALKEHFDLLGPFKGSELDAMSASDRSRVQAMVVTSSAARELVDAFPNLGLIACLGSGFEGIDMQLARSRGIAVTHNPSGNTSAVAEFAVGALIALDRRILTGDQFVRDGKWPGVFPGLRLPFPQGIAGRKVGIYGLGTIGKKIAARLAPFEVELGYHNRRPADAPYRYFETPLGLARWCNVLILSLRGNAESRRVVGREILDALGPSGLLVNVARGSVADEEELVAALVEKRIAGAALDVFEEEPNVPEALKTLANVILTPHEAGMSTQATNVGRALLVENIKAFLAGRPVLTPVPA